MQNDGTSAPVARMAKFLTIVSLTRPFVCDLVKKSRGGGGCFFLREGVARGAMFPN